MNLAKLTKILDAATALADTAREKGVKVSIPANVSGLKEGAKVVISAIERLEKPQAKGKPIEVVRANVIEHAPEAVAKFESAQPRDPAQPKAEK
jgi:hypothetical protein